MTEFAEVAEALGTLRLNALGSISVVHLNQSPNLVGIPSDFHTEVCIGLTLAPEKYQQIIRDVLRGCAGVANIVNDLIIHEKEVANTTNVFLWCWTG